MAKLVRGSESAFLPGQNQTVRTEADGMTEAQAAELLAWMPKFWLCGRLILGFIILLVGGQLLQSYRMGRME